MSTFYGSTDGAVCLRRGLGSLDVARELPLRMPGLIALERRADLIAMRSLLMPLPSTLFPSLSPYLPVSFSLLLFTSMTGLNWP
jgi:hypothetical protein